MSKRPSTPPKPSPSPRETPSSASPLQDASEAELGQLVDDVLASSKFRTTTGESVPRAQEPRFHAEGRSIAERREAEAAALPTAPESLLQDVPESLDEWYLAIEGKTVGPLTLKTMETFWDDGTIDPDMLCWRAGLAGWLPVRSVEALVQAFTRRPELANAASAKEISGSWKPVAGPVLERLRKEQVVPSRPLPPPPLPPPPVDMSEVIRSTVRELTPLIQPKAEPAKSSLLPVALASGVLSGVLVALVFLLMRPDAPSPSTPAPPAVREVPAAPAPRSPRASSAQPVREGARPPPPRRAPSRSGRPPVAAPAPKDKVDEALEEPLPYETRDTLSQSEVASVVLSHKAEVDSCISQFAPSNPEAPPRLVMRWKVDPEGRASEVVALNEDFRGGPLAGCMAKQIARWSFPKHPAARDSVIFPFPLPR